jgi:enoyl-CoA hydratase
MGLVSRVVGDGAALEEGLAAAGGMCRFSPYGLSMTKNALWASLEIGSLETAIELEDRNQLMLGFTENLQEAIRAFDAGRQPVYTDEPRRDLFDGP